MKAIYNIGRESIPYAKEAIKGTLKAVTNTPTTEVMLNKNCHEIEDRIDIAPKKEAFSFNKMFSYKPSLSQQVAKNIVNYQNYQRFEQNSGLNTLSRSFSTSTRFYSSTTGMEKPIDVTSDYMFKGIFSNEERTANFLESVLVGNSKILPEGTKIEEIQYLKTEYIQSKIPEDAKKIIFDLQVKTSNGIFIIEMQKNVSTDYLKRMEFYNATAYSQQQIKGNDSSSMKDYTKALPIVTISIMSKNLFSDTVPCVSYHVNMERKTQAQHMKAFSYVFIELEKFDEQSTLENITEDEKDWLSFMKMQKLDHKYHNEQVNSAVKYVQDIRDHKYDDYLRAQMSELAAQKEIESAEEKGKAEGKAELIKKMLDKGKSTEEIIELTDLTKDEIEKIKNTDLSKEK